MRKRKFSEYEMAFIPFQTLGACSLPRSPRLTYPPYTVSSLPAFHYFHTNFIETQPQAQVRSVPILTPTAVSGPQMAD